MEDLDLSNMDLIGHLNFMLRICGSFETTDSTAFTVSRLEYGIATKKFKPSKDCFIRIYENMFENIKDKFVRMLS
jgi:hypothetical protein